MLENLYRTVCPNNPPVARMNFVNAELTKISVNTFVTTKISYANMLADDGEQVPGADAEVVSSAIGLDTRIGRKYLKGAFGYGGPCFPRDNKAFARFAELHDVDATLARYADQVNQRQVDRLAARVLEAVSEGDRVAILGLAYKPDTEVIDESQGVMLAQVLPLSGVKVLAYDPLAMDNARRVLNGLVEFAPSMAACVGEAGVVVIATAWDEFKARSGGFIVEEPAAGDLRLVWHMLRPADFEPIADYIACGLHRSRTLVEAPARGRIETVNPRMKKL